VLTTCGVKVNPQMLIFNKFPFFPKWLRLELGEAETDPRSVPGGNFTLEQEDILMQPGTLEFSDALVVNMYKH
jgi:hypothetical protein